MTAKKSRSRSANSSPAPAQQPRPAPGAATASAASGGGKLAPSWCLSVGLWGLLAWLAGGAALEGLLAFKAPLYLQDETRRHLWTLAHAHGTLLALACLVLAILAPRLGMPRAVERTADRLFAAGALLLPLGFFLGGLAHPEGDPNAFILLTPVGALCAGGGLLLLALRPRAPEGEDAGEG